MANVVIRPGQYYEQLVAEVDGAKIVVQPGQFYEQLVVPADGPDPVITPGQYYGQLIADVEAGADFPIPTFVAAGDGASAVSSTTLSVPFPATIAANDLLLAHLTNRTTTAGNPTTPDGWDITTLAGELNVRGQNDVHYYLKFAVGDETGNLDFTVGSEANGWFGRMYAFRGVKLTSFLEGSAVLTGTDENVLAPSVTTLGANRLAVALVSVSDDNALASFTGETGGAWAEAVAEYASADGADCALGVQTADMAVAATISGGTNTMAAADPWHARAFALIPG